MPKPPEGRDRSTPWPTWPLMMRTSSAHEEGGERIYSINTTIGVNMDPVIILGLIITALTLGLTFWLYKDDIS